VARWVPVGRFDVERAAPLLRELLTSHQVFEACDAVRKKLVGADGIAQTCNLIETLAAGAGLKHPAGPEVQAPGRFRAPSPS